MKLVSLTGFAPVVSCMRGRHVDWTTPQGRKKWWEVLEDGHQRAAHFTSRMPNERSQIVIVLHYVNGSSP